MKTFLSDVKRNWKYLMLTMPVVIYFIMFMYVPKFGIVLAFKDFKYNKGIFGSEWNGLDNFKFLFESGNFGIIMRNTLGYSIVFLVSGVIFGVLLAILFDALGRTKLNKVNQTLVILPHFLSMMIVSYFTDLFLSTDKGILNSIIISLGGEAIDFYSTPKYWPFILFFVNWWKTTGWGAVIYYATIKGFDQSCYEAAHIDGATWWQSVKYITLPLLKPIIIIMFINNIGHILSTGSDLFYYIPKNSGPLYNMTTTIDAYVFRNILSGNNYGMTSAVSLFKSVIGTILILTTNGLVRKFSPGDELF